MPTKKEILNELFRTRNLTLVIVLSIWILVVSFPWQKYIKQPASTSSKPKSLGRRCRLALHRLLTYEMPVWPFMTAVQLLSLAGLVVILIPLCIIDLNWESSKEYQLYGHLAIGLMLLGSILPLRKSLYDWIFGISFNELVFLHRWIGTLVIVLSWLHGALYLIRWMKKNIVWEELTEEQNAVGFAAGVIMFVMLLLSLPIVRRRWFTLFKWFHILSVPSLIGLLIVHAPKTKNYMYALIAFYGFDLVLRYLSMVFPVSFKGSKQREGLVKMYLHQAANWLSPPPKPGQFYFLYAPKAGISISHPFSVVSGTSSSSAIHGMTDVTRRISRMNAADLESGLTLAADANNNTNGIPRRGSNNSDTSTLYQSALRDANLVFSVRSLGPFSSRLRTIMESAQSGEETPLIRLEGPYGRSFDGALNADVIVLAGGGIGAAPLFSLIDSLLQNSLNKKLPHIEFIWAVRRCAQIKWFKEEMQLLMSHTSINIRIHITGQDEMLPSPAEGYTTVATPVPALATPFPNEKKDSEIVGPTSPRSDSPSHDQQSHLTNQTTVGHDVIEQVIVDPYCLYKGRPCFQSILRQVKQQFPSSNVSVAACGPSSLIRDVRQSCLNVSDTDGIFTLFTEEFEY